MNFRYVKTFSRPDVSSGIPARMRLPKYPFVHAISQRRGEMFKFLPVVLLIFPYSPMIYYTFYKYNF